RNSIDRRSQRSGRWGRSTPISPRLFHSGRCVGTHGVRPGKMKVLGPGSDTRTNGRAGWFQDARRASLQGLIIDFNEVVISGWKWLSFRSLKKNPDVLVWGLRNDCRVAGTHRVLLKKNWSLAWWFREARCVKRIGPDRCSGTHAVRPYRDSCWITMRVFVFCGYLVLPVEIIIFFELGRRLFLIGAAAVAEYRLQLGDLVLDVFADFLAYRLRVVYDAIIVGSAGDFQIEFALTIARVFYR